jgi:hypothetical protein
VNIASSTTAAPCRPFSDQELLADIELAPGKDVRGGVSAVKSGGICVLSGVSSTGAPRLGFAQLPRECRPSPGR